VVRLPKSKTALVWESVDEVDFSVFEKSPGIRHGKI